MSLLSGIRSLFRDRRQPDKPERAFPAAMVCRGFAAAEVSRLLDGWRFDGGFTARETSAALYTIRSRSREMEKNSPHYKRFLDLFVTNVVGEGFALKSTPYDGGSLEQRLDVNAAKTIENHWWLFGTQRNEHGQTFCDASGRKTMAEFVRMLARTWARDGEYFVLITRTDRNPYGIEFQAVRPDYCDERYNVAETPGGTTIRAGVELETATGRPVAYWFRTPSREHADGYFGSQALVRIPAERVIHGFTQHDENQTRGIPMGYASLIKLKMLDEYDRAELTAARDEACTVRSYYAPAGQEQAIADLSDSENEDAAKKLLVAKEPGQIEILPLGYKQEVHTPQHPNRELTAFKNSMGRDIAGGLGLEYATFFNDWAGVSYSSVRAGTLAERDMWMVLQDDMISQCMSRMFLPWLRAFLESDISGGLPVAKFDKFSEHIFRGRRWLWVDPLKDIRAAEIAVKNGWKTNGQIAEEYGGDIFDNLDAIKREEQAFKGTRLEHKQKEPEKTEPGKSGAAKTEKSE